MKNAAPYIREQLVTLLDGVITYDGETIPVYENEGVMDGSVKYQILIKDQSSTPDNTKRSFSNQTTAVIEVISETSSSVRKHVDVIGNEVLALLKPTTQTTGIPDSAVWQIANLEISTRYLTDEGGAETKIVRLILELNFTTIEK